MAPYEAQRFEYERTAGTWYDVTGWVDTEASPAVSAEGRPSGFDSHTNGVGSITLNNADGRWTPGNVLSPEYPYWRQGRRIRCRETIGYRTFDTWTQYVVPPEITEWVESGDSTITVPLIDRLGWLDTSRTFFSTLAEHIRYNGGTALKAYWPMGETGTATKFASLIQNQPAMDLITILSSVAPDGTAKFEMGTQPSLLGDDLPRPLSSPQIFSGTAVNGVYPQGGVVPSITVGVGEYLTIGWWATPTGPTTIGYELELIGSNYTFSIVVSAVTGRWEALIEDAGLTFQAIAAGDLLAIGHTEFMSATVTPGASGSLTFYQGSKQFAGTVTIGTLPSSLSGAGILVINNFVGSFSHVQAYKGSATDWTFTKHQAQFLMGWSGLDRQRTDDRIRTLAHYAGVPDSGLALDVGTAVMGPVSLAGQKASALMRTATDTERGRLFVNGTDQVTFHGRTRTYNI